MDRISPGIQALLIHLICRRATSKKFAFGREAGAELGIGNYGLKDGMKAEKKDFRFRSWITSKRGAGMGGAAEVKKPSSTETLGIVPIDFFLALHFYPFPSERKITGGLGFSFPILAGVKN